MLKIFSWSLECNLKTLVKKLTWKFIYYIVLKKINWFLYIENLHNLYCIRLIRINNIAVSQLMSRVVIELKWIFIKQMIVEQNVETMRVTMCK